MPKGVTTKGYKMTQGRKRILELLVEEGGEIRSSDGGATSLMHGILDAGSSLVAFSASLRQLEAINLITREIAGKRTYAIAITDLGYEALGLEVPTEDEQESQTTEPETTSDPAVNEAQWEWSEDNGEVDVASISDQIDYEVLLGLFVKAALRGLEGPSNSELDYYKQQNELLTKSLQVSEAKEQKSLAQAASAIAERDQAIKRAEQAEGERDQLDKTVKTIMSRSESNRVGRGTDPIRKLLKPDERAALDALMRQVPTRRGD